MTGISSMVGVRGAPQRTRRETGPFGVISWTVVNAETGAVVSIAVLDMTVNLDHERCEK